jgi:folylpolyglutamate synthase
LGLAGSHQYGNATLAWRLCQAVVAKDAKTLRLDDPKTIQALTSASWPGRCQTVEHSPFTFRLDGAHTPQSLSATMEWFTDKASTPRILVFTCSHERNPVELLQLLVPAKFDSVYFAKADSSRPSPVSVPSAIELLQSHGIPVVPDLLVASNATPTWQETLASVWKHLLTKEYSDCKVQCNVTAKQVMEDLAASSTTTSDNTAEVLVTGSLYLVGSFLTAMEWNEESSPDFGDL